MNEYDRMIMDGGKVCNVYHIISYDNEVACIYIYFLATNPSMIEYNRTPPIPIEHPNNFMGLSDSPITTATPTMTITRLAVLATDWVTALVFLRVSVAHSL
mmetsp:Transcript_35874/g.40349  ORF Transcript_35874/g.40349 Transcript_35874/m.40349 type:complete len:101 (-) Transcript_35874:93-395(-)